MEVFVARQPIFNNKLEVCAYEILYRMGDKADLIADGDLTTSELIADGDLATSEVIAGSFLLIGLETLTGGRRAFINFTSNLLLDGTAALLPKETCAIEVLENVEPSPEILTVLHNLKRQGYCIVLDDFVFNRKLCPLVELADIVKVDFLTTPNEEKFNLVKRLGHRRIEFLAEKVETRENFELALKSGYTYFQGYFFSEPVIVSGNDIPGYKLSYLHMLQEASRSDLNFDHAESIIKRDVSLSYKLLKYINSAAFGFRTKISSIKQALVLLGILEIRRWVSLISLRGLGQDSPDEIMTNSIVRARFGELLAPKIGFPNYSYDLFMMGMFSMIDALMGRPIEEIVQDLPISDEIKYVLLGRESCYSKPYSLIIAYEKGDWQSFTDLAAGYQLNQKEIPGLYLEAIQWANQLTQLG